ncbi:MAG: phosphatase, partial [Clostridiales bacterium]
MSKIIDLHSHTVCSDGTYTVKEIIDYAHKKGLSALAISDH